MKREVSLLVLALVAAPGLACAQDTVSELIVSRSPYGAADSSIAKTPHAVDVLDSRDLDRTGAASILRALGESAGEIQINNAQANPFQPNVTYRGFDASPLVGNAQGLAVYVDGGRFNQSFGDTVNWDLLPDVAIKSLAIEGSNPTYGLNALGGSIAINLKTAADQEGFEGSVSGGSFGRRQGSAEFGGKIGEAGLYLAASALNDDGWRDFSPSELRQVYGRLTFEGERHTTHISLMGADNDLTGNGTSPVELLAVNRAAVFTHPDRTQNQYGRLNLTTDFKLSDVLSLQGGVYYADFRQRSENGDAADVDECDAPDDAFLCLEDELDEPLEDANGDEIPDFLAGGDYAFLNRGVTDTRSLGASLQARISSPLFGRPNQMIIGGSFDGGRSKFRASSELGELSADRGYAGPGVIVESDEIGSVAVNTRNSYYGLFISNAIELSDTVTLTASGRYNAADVTLRDQIGTALNGDHSFSRFNPAIGLTWAAADGLSLYGGYAEANRAPTPAELSCADPLAPCSLTNFFVGDPPLEQVVARTFEAGARGQYTLFGGKARWNLGAFRTETDDDIMFIASTIPGRAYFQNVGETRRQGVQADMTVRHDNSAFALSWTVTDATFQSPLTLNSPENPLADVNGQIFVVPGNDMPGVARNKIKATYDRDLTDRLSVGVSAVYQSGQYLYGDEANANPKTNGFTVVNLQAAYDITPRVSVFAYAENLFDKAYETFGTFSPVDEVPLVEVPGASDTRSLSPAPPRSLYIGLKARF